MNDSKKRTFVDIETGEEIELFEDIRIDKEGNQEIRLVSEYLQTPKLAPAPTSVGVDTNLEAKKLKNRAVQWMKANMSAVFARLGKANISGRALRVNMALGVEAHWHGYVTASLEKIATMTGIDKADVSRAIKELEEADALVTIKRGQYRLNPALYWAGSDVAQQKALGEYSYQRGKVAAKEKAKAKAAKAKKPKLRLVHSQN